MDLGLKGALLVCGQKHFLLSQVKQVLLDTIDIYRRNRERVVPSGCCRPVGASHKHPEVHFLRLESLLFRSCPGVGHHAEGDVLSPDDSLMADIYHLVNVEFSCLL